jgi:hypothetical protein
MDIFATLHSGQVAYDRNEAAVDISEFIEALEQAREDGATKVVGLSGNYRGARYVKISTSIGFEEDES